MDPSIAEALPCTFSLHVARTSLIPRSAPKPSVQSTACLTEHAGWAWGGGGRTAGEASTTYPHQPPCRPFTYTPNLKPALALTLFTELPFNTKKCTLHTLCKPTQRHPFRPRVHSSLSRTTPRNRRTLPAGYLPDRLPLPLAGTSAPVAAWSRLRSAVLSHTLTTFAASCTGAPLASPTLLLSAP